MLTEEAHLHTELKISISNIPSTFCLHCMSTTGGEILYEIHRDSIQGDFFFQSETNIPVEEIWKCSQQRLPWDAPIFISNGFPYSGQNCLDFFLLVFLSHYSSGFLFCVCLCLFPSQPCCWMSLVSIPSPSFPFHFVLGYFPFLSDDTVTLDFYLYLWIGQIFI